MRVTPKRPRPPDDAAPEGPARPAPPQPSDARPSTAFDAATAPQASPDPSSYLLVPRLDIATPGTRQLLDLSAAQFCNDRNTRPHFGYLRDEECLPLVLAGPKYNDFGGLRLGDIDVGWASLQGRRPHMEDRVIAQDTEYGTLVGVFDGHGGAEVAEAACRLVPEIIAEHLKGLDEAERREPLMVRKALKDAFATNSRKPSRTAGRTLEAAMATVTNSRAGATALLALFVGDCTYLVNLGDCRAVSFDEDGFALRLTLDHQPREPRERERLERLGSSVSYPRYGGGPPRVDGMLAVSRALGDPQFTLIRRPQVTCLRRHGPLLLASDGLFDTRVDDQVVATRLYEAHKLAKKGVKACQKITEELAYAALHRGSVDNITAVLIDRPNAAGPSVPEPAAPLPSEPAER